MSAKAEVLTRAKQLLEIEAQAVQRAASELGDDFYKALLAIQKAKTQGRKIVLMGIGKSHYVAAKLAASFISTGMTALFVHPAEAYHGDLGVIEERDVCILLSKSGQTAELLGLMPFLKKRNPVIAITGDLKSPLAVGADFVLNASVEREACPINMLPTASTTVALAIGDALVSICAEQFGFSKQSFAGYHPGGTIGRRLNTRVSDVMKKVTEVATGSDTISLKNVAQLMSEKAFGAFLVLNPQGELKGIITEGDLRRAIARGLDFSSAARELMNPNPVTLRVDMSLDEALSSIEQGKRKVNSAPVLDAGGRLVGLAQLHDLV